MATHLDTVEFITRQLRLAGEIRTRKMFGEFALYCNEKVVALICNDQLFVKMNETSLAFLDETHAARPYPGAKNYLQIPEDSLHEPEWLAELVRKTADSLPLPKPKKKRD